MGKYFGTDGFRGEANIKLTPIHAYKIGKYLAWFYRNINNRFLVGMDTRLSGSMLESALAAGLNSQGGNLYKLGVTTTPCVAYITKKEGFACGIMISASHNPYYDNGIKLIDSNGEKISDSLIEKIEDYIDDKIEIENATQDKIGISLDFSEANNLYIDYLIGLCPNLNGLKIGLDLANGSASSCAEAIFNKLGAEVIAINNLPDGLNINKNCGSTHIESLQKLVKKNKLTCGFAFDGDADRCLGVKEDGSVLDGDAIMYIYANYLKSMDKLKNNTVVTTVMSNIGLYKSLDLNNIQYVKTNVGDRFVYEYMKNNDCSIGGEQSGHIIFKDLATTGDGILTAIKILEVMIKENKSLCELTKDLEIYPQVLKNIKVKDKKIVLEDTDVKDSISEVESYLNDAGRILVRPSGTEPLIRVMVEAKTIDICNELVDKVINVIKIKGYELK